MEPTASPSPRSPAASDGEAGLHAIAALEALLEEERGAVAALQTDRLPALIERKLELAEQLRAALAALPGHGDRPAPGTDPDWEERRRALRAAAARVLAGAEANRLLLQDAVAALAEARGLHAPAGTYDAHARLASYATGRVLRTL